jgi:hypothetical protein
MLELTVFHILHFQFEILMDFSATGMNLHTKLRMIMSFNFIQDALNV